MFLTCLLNSRPPALKRNSFGILFHCFAAKYLKEFNPYFVVFTFGSDSVLLPLKSYLLFLISTSSLMHVGAVPWKQAFIVINNMSWTRRFSNVVPKLFAVAVHNKLMFYICKHVRPKFKFYRKSLLQGSNLLLIHNRQFESCFSHTNASKSRRPLQSLLLRYTPENA